MEQSEPQTNPEESKEKNIEAHGFLCCGKIYSFEGIEIEYGYCGPCPLTKLGDPKQRWSKKDHEAIDKFLSLTEEEQSKYRVGGGCIQF